MEFSPMIFSNEYPVKDKGYIVIPAEFISVEENEFSELSFDAGVLYCLLRNRANASVNNPKFTRGGRAFVYCSQKEIKQRFKCCISKAAQLLKELESFGLIEREHIGHGHHDRIFVNDYKGRPYIISEKLKQLLEKEEEKKARATMDKTE